MTDQQIAKIGHDPDELSWYMIPAIWQRWKGSAEKLKIMAYMQEDFK